MPFFIAPKAKEGSRKTKEEFSQADSVSHLRFLKNRLFGRSRARGSPKMS